MNGGLAGVRDPMPGVVYPEPERLNLYLREGILTRETLGGALHLAAARFAGRLALRNRDRSRDFTYRELDELSDRFGAALLDLGLKPRDRVIFQLGNVEELFFCLHGCFKAGIVPVASLPNHRAQEIGYIAEHAGARAHIVQAGYRHDDLPRLARELAAQNPSIQHLISVGDECDGLISFDELVENQDPRRSRRRLEELALDPFDVAIFQLSGGTTGVPKIIPRFHNEYLLNMRAWGVASAYDQETIVYWPLPIIHNAGLVCGAGPVHLFGGCVVLQESLEPEALLGAIQNERVTTVAAAIPLIVRILDSGAAAHHDLSSVRDFMSAGEAALIQRELQVPAYHLFGMSEGVCMRTRREHPETVRMSTVGEPLSAFDEIRLLEPGGSDEVPLGEVGELCCRGPYTIRGYYRAEDHNHRVFTPDGFYRSGDLMRARRLGDRTYYSFEGRIKDNIDRGGEKISAEEVERIALEHPDVREIAVIGMPDREFGERVCAYVIPEVGQQAPSVEVLRDFLLARGLARYKCPERVEPTDTFPVTDVGKISKPALRADIQRKLGRR